MWPDGYYYQRQTFYNYRWTKEMEHTFVDSLLHHANHGQFRVGRENKHAVLCSLRAVNKAHGTKVTAEWARSRVVRLKERHDVFHWLISRTDVVWNRSLKYVTASDTVWDEICSEKQLARCYINAYEDLFEDLCVIFGVPVPNEQVGFPFIVAPAQVLAANEVVEHPPVVDLDPLPPNGELPILMPAGVVNIVSDSSYFGDSFWNFIEAYYASDSESDDKLPALPGVPSIGPNVSDAAYSPGGHSNGAGSSCASNATPIKKEP